MRRICCAIVVVSLMLSIHIPRAFAFDWADVTDAEKTMKSNPLDPGAGAVVLFKRGRIEVLEKSSLFWTTRILTYTRIKIFNDAGREYANVSVDAPKYIRMSKIEGRTILPSGQIIPLDSSQVFRGRSFEAGRNYAILKTSFSFPSVETGAIIEYQTEEYVDWFFPPPWIFDTNEVGTLDSTLQVVIGPRLGMSQFPLDTTVTKLSFSRKDTVLGTRSGTNLTPCPSATRPRWSYLLPASWLSQGKFFLSLQNGMTLAKKCRNSTAIWKRMRKKLRTKRSNLPRNSRKRETKRRRSTSIFSRTLHPAISSESVWAGLRMT